MFSHNRNWNDRANKDLFFTILSVKNIGIISGVEWSTIGNHMRTLGYGFTNEGCRQHFQGLRRGMEKGDIPSTTTSNNSRVDPTFNPITRRPGPGRGRPRKNANAAPPKQTVPASTTASMAAHSIHVAPEAHLTGDLDDLQALQAVSQDSIGLRGAGSSKGPHGDGIVLDAQVEGLDADADGEADDFGAADMRPSKRQRVMDGGVDLGDHDAGDILDDEAVLALAAHNTGDVFSPDDEV